MLANLFCLPAGGVNTTGVVVTFVLVFACAFLTKRKHLLFLACYLLFTPLPVNFITPRNLFAVYVTWAGWAIYAAIVLVEGRDWLWKRVWGRPPIPPNDWEPERILLLLSVALVIRAAAQSSPISWADALPVRNSIYALITGLQRIPSPPKRDDAVLFLNDKFSTEDWQPVLIVRLYYRDPNLRVDRVKMMKRPPDRAEISRYHFVFDYAGDQLVLVPGSDAKPGTAW